jgi:hypothetical protein
MSRVAPTAAVAQFRPLPRRGELASRCPRRKHLRSSETLTLRRLQAAYHPLRGADARGRSSLHGHAGRVSLCASGAGAAERSKAGKVLRGGSRIPPPLRPATRWRVTQPAGASCWSCTRRRPCARAPSASPLSTRAGWTWCAAAYPPYAPPPFLHSLSQPLSHLAHPLSLTTWV